nr:bax inhibitor 1-like [Penaeus vannamei]
MPVCGVCRGGDIPVRIYLKNMNLKNKYETPVRIHLKNVYATLTLATIAASLQRLSLLGIFAFLTGCNLGPFLNLAVTINPALANLYIGLAVMCGFIVYDTQFIVERARRGDMDYVMHSLNLFVDFVGVFWRLLMILTNKVKHLFEDLLYCHFYC